MSGCSLHEAFPDTGETAKKQRVKAKRSEGPALTFLKGADPDRQTFELPPAEKLEGREGFVNAKLMEGYAEQDHNAKFLSSQKVDDVIGQRTRKNLPNSARSESTSVSPDYFGKSINDGFRNSKHDGFADFSSSMTDNPGYQVQGADFSSFDQKGLEKIAGKQTLPVPNLNNVWKPMTPSGINTSFFPESEPVAPVPVAPAAPDEVFSRDEKLALINKIDTLFARLDSLELKRNEYAHAEVTLFILSGLFLMFGLETARKLH